jgi:hypothetical protein
MTIERNFNQLINLFELLEANTDPRSKAAERLVYETSKEFADAFERQTGAAWDWIVDHYYPPKRSGKVRWTSDKQRRWFWAQVRAGLIKVPYQRTNQLLKATDAEPIDITATGFTIQVSVDLKKAPHGPYVVGLKQQRFHKDTGWPQLQSIVEQSGFVVSFANHSVDAYVHNLRGIVNGAAL